MYFSNLSGLSIEQITNVVQFYIKTKYIIRTKRKYRSVFGPKNTPSSHTIFRLTQNFIATGTTSERSRSERNPIVSTDKIVTAKEMAEKTPTPSICRQPSRSTHRNLQLPLKGYWGRHWNFAHAHMPYKFINCCSAKAYLRPWHIYFCITNSLLFRDILAKKIKLSPFLP